MNLLFSLMLSLTIVIPLVPQQDYSFDLSEIEKKKFNFGGYAEVIPSVFNLNTGSPLYLLRYYDSRPGDYEAGLDFRVLFDAGWTEGPFSADLRANLSLNGSEGQWNAGFDLYEGKIAWKPSLNFFLEAGKQRLKWGKGYAWNPVAFIDRVKNPNDPELALEGYTVIRAEYVKSFRGHLRTLTLTGLLVPSASWVNEDIGEKDTLNLAGKVYLLYADTDINFMFLAGSGVAEKCGLDFSRNLVSNFEVHGEGAWNFGEKFSLLDNEGKPFETKKRGFSGLLGLRYLAPTNTTFFLEIYHNDLGLKKNELQKYYSFINEAADHFNLSSDRALMENLSGKQGASYQGFTPMQNYLFLRAVQKEPFNILYFYPAMTGIFNLDDGSFLATVELLYNPITNVELRARAVILRGDGFSEFGGKPNKHRWELRLRVYF
ncbi:MAG: hypothetical protein JXB26_08845 [Candidatus Aminicenantes bacterium]|nr:hypothetical protein [Candidatus Aminicenantes bacterium]